MAYLLVKIFLQTSFLFFFQRVKIFNRKSIPKRKPLILVANHPNALIDPLVVAYDIKRPVHFITRSSVFGNKWLDKFFAAVHMFPIYRPRDGRELMVKNAGIFKKCEKVLANNGCILIFGEGSHDLTRKIRQLKTGFARICLGTLENEDVEDVLIQSVGINYDNPTHAFSNIGVSFGKVISVKETIGNESDDAKKIQMLAELVRKNILDQAVHINDENYHEKLEEIKSRTSLHLIEQVKRIQLNPSDHKKQSKPLIQTVYTKIVYFSLLVNFWMTFAIWLKNKSRIKEPEFLLTFKFAVSAAFAVLNIALNLTIIALSPLGFDWILTYLQITILQFIFMKLPLFDSKLIKHYEK